jgi:hypothetical protein
MSGRFLALLCCITAKRKAIKQVKRLGVYRAHHSNKIYLIKYSQTIFFLG